MKPNLPQKESNIYKSVYMYVMNHLVNLAGDVYAELTRRKKMRKASYSEVVRELLKAKVIAVEVAVVAVALSATTVS